MPRAVALRHVAFEDLDSFEDALAARGFDISYRESPVDNLAAPELDDADLLVVLGGPIGAYEEATYPFLTREIALIERRLAQGKKVLGICLGAQLMARALGARVYPSGLKELGWAPLALTKAGEESCLAGFGSDVAVLHWHGDTFDLPAGAVHLASTPRIENQAFQWRDHGLALQFHIEATPSGLERWYVGHTLEIATTEGVSVPALRAKAARCAPATIAAARDALYRWLDGPAR